MAKKNVEVSEKKVGFFKGTLDELKQVTWPTKGELASKTAVVLAVVIIATLFVWFTDTVLSKLLSIIVR